MNHYVFERSWRAVAFLSGLEQDSKRTTKAQRLKDSQRILFIALSLYVSVAAFKNVFFVFLRAFVVAFVPFITKTRSPQECVLL